MHSTKEFEVTERNDGQWDVVSLSSDGSRKVVRTCRTRIQAVRHAERVNRGLQRPEKEKEPLIEFSSRLEYALELSKELESERRANDQVYVIGSDLPPYKVGISLDPAKRLASIVSSSGNQDLRILYSIQCGAATASIETSVHISLREYRLHGEWFDCDLDTIIRLIDQSKKYYEENSEQIQKRTIRKTKKTHGLLIDEVKKIKAGDLDTYSLTYFTSRDVDLYCKCAQCGDYRIVRPKHLLPLFGDKASIASISKSLHCNHCGNTGLDIQPIKMP